MPGFLSKKKTKLMDDKLQFFTILGDKELGKILLPPFLDYEETRCMVPTIMHGRSMAIKQEKYKWILVKGGGWNYKGPDVYISRKEEEMIFGLYSEFQAKRELQISKIIESFSDRFPKVLFFERFQDYDLPEKYSFLKDAKFSNGRYAKPGLLFTEVKCPFRVADLAFLNNKEKRELIKYCCRYWNIKEGDFVAKFAYELGINVATYHLNNIINDTLEYSNVTMLSEIVDYELMTAPDVAFQDGSLGLFKLDERREKEVLYGAEVVLQLEALLHQEYSLYDAYEKFVDGYKTVNPELIVNNNFIKQILERKKVIL